MRRRPSVALLLLGALLGVACADAERGPRAGSETHFLVPCESDSDCAAIGPEQRCEAGYCRAGGAPAASGGGAGSGGATCAENAMAPSELLVIGDSLIELSGMTRFLEELARSEGTLAPDQSFRDESSALNSFLADNALSIGGQYRNAAEQAPVRAVIMNGGATDMMQLGCADPPSADCPLVVSALAGARTVLARMAEDGVEAVVYCFYADPVANPSLGARLDLLRPLMAETCQESQVPCHFLDLRSVFAGHYADYVGPDGIVWSEPGARATAGAIWHVMEDACIAR